MGSGMYAYYHNTYGEEFVLHAGDDFYHVQRQADGRFYIGKHWVYSMQPTLCSRMVDGILARDIEHAFSEWQGDHYYAMSQLTAIVLYAYWGKM